MAKYPDYGALPHRTVRPRGGELSSTPDIEASAFVPLLYADTKTLAPDHVALRCPSCGLAFVHVSGLAIAQRNDYMEVSRVQVSEWNEQSSSEWKSVPISEHVKGDSVLIEILCEEGHVSVMELGSHKSLTSTRVTRISDSEASRRITGRE